MPGRSRGGLPLIERIARMEEALTRFEEATHSVLREVMASMRRQEERIEALERALNHQAGAAEARAWWWENIKYLVALLVSAMTGSVMALIIGRMLA